LIGVKSFGKTRVSVSNAAILSNPDAMIKCGERYFNGESVPQIPERGFGMLERASELGSTEAINKLALCYEVGRGVAFKSKQLCNFYRKMAEKATDPSALDQLCQSIPSENEDIVLNCLKIASVFGCTNASYLVGMKLKAKDDKRAFEYFRRASDGRIL